jgi:hypothetical protein
VNVGQRLQKVLVHQHCLLQLFHNHILLFSQSLGLPPQFKNLSPVEPSDAACGAGCTHRQIGDNPIQQFRSFQAVRRKSRPS